MRKWIRNILKGTSLSAALFVFQACYGMPDGYKEEYNLGFEVVDGNTLKPIPDVDVYYRDSGSTAWKSAGKTDRNGRNYLYPFNSKSLDFKFEAENYQSRDTTIMDFSYRVITIKMSEE